MRSSLRRLLCVLPVLGLVLAGCSTSSGTPATSSAGTTTSSIEQSSGATAEPADGYYISIGDSYGAGFRPTLGGSSETSTDGFAYQLLDKAKASGLDVDLFNVACSGATSGEVLKQNGCASNSLGPDATPYPAETQLQTALDFINSHPGDIELITIVIGGNDVTGCIDAKATEFGTATTDCIATKLAELKANLADVLTQLRAAVGTDVRIVGITYPDIFLGAYVVGNWQLAVASKTLFQDELNPTLKAEYDKAQATFIDTTQLTGAYGPEDVMTTVDPYGSIPEPVAKICELTYYCSMQDVHPNKDGHAVIAEAVASAIGLT